MLKLRLHTAFLAALLAVASAPAFAAGEAVDFTSLNSAFSAAVTGMSGMVSANMVVALALVGLIAGGSWLMKLLRRSY